MGVKEGFEPSSTSATGNLNEDAQEVIKDNLEVMKDIIVQIREDPEFAKNIYADCPRLQHMLEERPDLRPVFEDPDLVRINFEQVYQQEGGVLPEDEEKKKKSILAAIVNSPCFKVLRVFLLIKKLLGCIFGGGFAFIKSCVTGCCCDSADLAADALDADMDADAPDADPKNVANKEALNKAADHMEDPEVQEQMNDLLENDPEGLQDAIENDPELRELRDSNPLCAELMSDPETMKILTDPENLRALGEAPELIEADFADPDWQPPEGDIESGGADRAGVATNTVGFTDMAVDAVDLDADMDVDADADNDVENPDEEGEEGDEEDGEEEEEEEGMADDFELGESENDGGNKNANANKGNQNKNKQQQQKNNENGQGGGGGGFLSQVGAGITDMLAAELVGVGFSEMTGGDDPLAGLEDDAADQAADAADEAAEGAEDAADQAQNVADQVAMAAAASETVMDDDMVGNLEDGMDGIEDTHDEKQDAKGGEESNKAAVAAGGAAAGAAVIGGGAAGVAMSRGTGDEEEGSVASQEGEEEGEKKKKGKFGFVGKWAAAVSTAGKEYIASAVLGDDLGEMIVEKIEDDEEDDDDKSTKSDEENPDKEDDKKEEEEKEEKQEKKRRGLLRRKR